MGHILSGIGTCYILRQVYRGFNTSCDDLRGTRQVLLMFICFWNFNLHFMLLSLKFLTDIRTGDLASKTFQMCSLQSSMSCAPLYLFLFIYFILTARLVYGNGDYIIIEMIFKRNRRSCKGIAITIHVFSENTEKEVE